VAEAAFAARARARKAADDASSGGGAARHEALERRPAAAAERDHARMLNTPPERAAPVVQRKIAVTPEFAKIDPLMAAYKHISVVIAQDDLLRELYEHAELDAGDLIFTVGDAGGNVGLTEFFLDGVDIRNIDQFTKLVASKDYRVSGLRPTTRIIINYARISKMLEEGADEDQSTDLLQILAHEYGVHATKHLGFLNELKRFDGKRDELIAYCAEQHGADGSMSGGTHHQAYKKGNDPYYGRLSAGVQSGLGQQPEALESFRASERRDLGMQEKVYGLLNPAIEDIAKLSKKAQDMTTGSVSFKRQATAKPQEEKCFITTACTMARGLPDDCEELTVLRWFRDEILCRFEEGRAVCAHYNRVSPGIVQAIAVAGREDEFYARLYRVIRYCVDAVRRGDYLSAFHTYAGMVLLLQQRFPAADREGAG
jgi:hypothetical protein